MDQVSAFSAICAMREKPKSEVGRVEVKIIQIKALYGATSFIHHMRWVWHIPKKAIKVLCNVKRRKTVKIFKLLVTRFSHYSVFFSSSTPEVRPTALYAPFELLSDQPLSV